MPPREPLKGQIDDQRQALADLRSDLEAARRDLVTHEEAIAKAEALLADLKESVPEPGPLDLEDIERQDKPETPSGKDRLKIPKTVKKAGRAAAVEVAILWAQVKRAEWRVNELRNDQSAASLVEDFETLVDQAEARLEALLRKQRAMTGGDSPP